MPAGMDEMWAFVDDVLAQQWGERRDEPDGSVSVAVGDRRLHAVVLPMGPTAAVQLHTPLVVDVPDSDALCEAVATVELTLGKLLLVPGDADGTRTVLLAHRLRADDLVADDLVLAARATLADADRLDPPFEAAFGATWTLEPGE